MSSTSSSSAPGRPDARWPAGCPRTRHCGCCCSKRAVPTTSSRSGSRPGSTRTGAPGWTGTTRRSRSPASTAGGVLAARQAAGWLVLDQRDDLHPGRARRLRRVGRADREPSLVLRPRAAAVPPDGGQRPRSGRFHGVGGPLRVEDLRSPHPWTRAVVASAVAAGYPRNDDFNGATQEGVGQYQVTQKRGRRWSAADAYLRPAAGRPNLTVRTGALTTRVMVEGGRAAGVEYRCGGRLQTVRAAREVVLSGGAVNSPQLLMLSGIGPADHLREVGVDVVHDLPGVGGGLQ